jgi:hypothetical protein
MRDLPRKLGVGLDRLAGGEVDKLNDMSYCVNPIRYQLKNFIA